MITVKALEHPSVRHGFLTRQGGVSTGIYNSLNCGFGSHDQNDHVAENRLRAMERLGLKDAPLVTCYQEHTSKALTVTTPWKAADSPVADALATKQTGIVLGILTADCAPVLLADQTAGVIGAAHAGWKGAVGGVLESVVKAMEDLGASRDNISAAVGPCIAQSSYEVGPDFPTPFLDQSPDNIKFFKPSPAEGHHLFDLAGYVSARLVALNLGRIDVAGVDTYAEEDKFFSFRRTTHRKEGDYGRQLSVIALDGAP